MDIPAIETELPAPHASVEYYRSIFERRTQEEIHVLSHIKRFMELLSGDPEFRGLLREHIDDLSVLAQKYKLDLDLNQLLPMFHVQYMKYRFTPEESQWPLARTWDDYMEEMMRDRDMLRASGCTAQSNPKFDAWRNRQMHRADGELGINGTAITHPLAAYELSQGCSVGCWFCGISAEKFEGYWPYSPENAEYWRGVLYKMTEIFGSGSQYGFCYWATDPTDNPDYPKFIEDHYRITGNLPQTTTAAPLRNVPLTREVLELFDDHKCVTNRFSILTLKQLHAVHETFTPEELMGVELVLQNRESMHRKSSAGRARAKLAEAKADSKIVASIGSTADGHETIACLTGFLINLQARTVQLVTPTRSSEQWPQGYRIYDTVHFTDVEDYGRAINQLIDTYMPTDLGSTDELAFRADLTYHRHPDGFELRSITGAATFEGFVGAGLLGDMIHKGTSTVAEVQLALIRSGSDIFVVTDLLRKLFDAGLLDDDPANGRIKPRVPAAQTGISTLSA